MLQPSQFTGFAVAGVMLTSSSLTHRQLALVALEWAEGYEVDANIIH